jgi:hypothetical protein
MTAYGSLDPINKKSSSSLKAPIKSLSCTKEKG